MSYIARPPISARDSIALLLGFNLLVASACHDSAESPSDGSWLDAGTDPTDAEGDAPTEFEPPDGGYKCIDLRPLPQGGAIRLVRQFDDTLSSEDLEGPIQLEQSPLDAERWYLVRQGGLLLTFRSGDREATTALDLSEDVWLGHPETGFVSIAFAPDFEESGWMYAVYATPGGDQLFLSRVSRFRSQDDGLTFDRDSEQILFDVPQRHGSHSVNHARFGPDDLLYVSLGDGQNPDDRLGNGQNPDTLYAAILRVDPSQSDQERGTAYVIPDDNPFADGGGAPEIYAWGLRNPWRFSFDRQSGEMWVGDVGQRSREEINRVELGGNYGWSDKEGSSCFNEPDCEEVEGLIEPYHEYTHNQGGVGRGGSVTGGYVYRGSANPHLAGRYIFADFKTGNIWALEVQEEAGAPAELLLESGYGIASFAQDEEGELYVVAYSKEGEGAIYRIESRERPNQEPQEVWLSETGCVRDDDPRKPIDEALPYDVTAALWSDGAEKSRALVMPPNGTMHVEDDGDFELPVGAVVLKTFGFDGDIHETRLLVHHENGWAGYSFEWNDERSDARLLPSGKTVMLSEGRSWTYPSRGDCKQCHTAAAGILLGLEWIQQGGQEALIEEMIDRGLFGDAIESEDDLSLSDVETLRDPFGSASRSVRARSYLHANCSGCHRPNVEGQQALIDLRFALPLKRTKTCGFEPELGSLYGAVTDPQVIRPGSSDRSVLYRRMTTLDLFRMPALGSEVVDEEGSDLIREWIDGMEGCP